MVPATELGNGHFLNDGIKRVEPVFVMELLPGVVGWIIGRAGARIKELQQCFTCKMWVDQDVPDDQPRKLFFQGPRTNIDYAVAEVNRLIGEAPLLGGRHGSAKTITCHIAECPADLVGLLIGKRGWTIKKIQLESGAQIAINQSIRNGLPRKVIVSGTEGSVRHALQLIDDVLRAKGQHVGVGPSETQDASTFREEYDIPTMDYSRFRQETLQRHIPETFHCKTYGSGNDLESISPSTIVDMSPTGDSSTLRRYFSLESDLNEAQIPESFTSSGNEKSSEYNLWGSVKKEDMFLSSISLREERPPVREGNEDRMFKESVFNWNNSQDTQPTRLGQGHYRSLPSHRSGGVKPSGISHPHFANDFYVGKNQDISLPTSSSVYVVDRGQIVNKLDPFYVKESNIPDRYTQNTAGVNYVNQHDLRNDFGGYAHRPEVNGRRSFPQAADLRTNHSSHLQTQMRLRSQGVDANRESSSQQLILRGNYSNANNN
eukprot:gene2589-3125_t